MIILDCYTTWCPKCKAVAPQIDKLTEEFEGKNVKFYKMNIEEAEDVAMEYGISAVPTFILFKGGEKVDEVVGPKGEMVKSMIEQNL